VDRCNHAIDDDGAARRVGIEEPFHPLPREAWTRRSPILD
jgi:hypothetical protein